MTNFNLGSLNDWQSIAAGEVMEFDLMDGGFRIVDFDVLADAPVSILAVSADTSQLVAYGSGLFSVRYSCDRSMAIGFHAEPDANIMVRTKMRSQQIAASDEETYTNIEPRPAGPSDEMRRMMMIVQLNARRREEAMRAEMDALRAERATDGQVIDAGDNPPADPNPAPAAPPAAPDA